MIENVTFRGVKVLTNAEIQELILDKYGNEENLSEWRGDLEARLIATILYLNEEIEYLNPVPGDSWADTDSEDEGVLYEE